MDKYTDRFRDRWWERILSDRRQYFFQKINQKHNSQIKTLSKVIGWIWDDARYLSRLGVNILLQLRAFGSMMKEKHGVSFWDQFKRMSYLAFILHVDPTNLRGRRLYLPQSWQFVDNYTYQHDKSQYLLAEQSYPDEIEIFEDKFLFFQFCQKNGISTPHIFGIFEKGQITCPGRETFDLPREDLFVKLLRGKAGQGIRKFNWTGNTFKDIRGKEYSTKELLAYLKEESHRSALVLQNVMVIHPAWSGFTSGALATCRIVTAKLPDEDSIIPLFASLRMPVGHTILDNFSKGGYYSGINLQTAEMSIGAGLKPVNRSFQFSEHPETGKKIEGTLLPYWKDILAFTIGVHSKLNTIFVGWDVSLAEDGPVLIEGNIGWASRSYECPNLKPLKETVYPVLYEKWLEKFMIE